jgi:hypothetical protein
MNASESLPPHGEREQTGSPGSLPARDRPASGLTAGLMPVPHREPDYLELLARVRDGLRRL